MQALDPILLAHLSARTGILFRTLIWITARNRATGESESLGLWNGSDHREFVIDGQTRPYYGAGTLIGMDNLRRSSGLDVRMLQIRLAPISPEVETAIRGYDARLAPVEIHRAWFFPDTMEPVCAPVRRFKGWVDEVKLPTPAADEENGEGECIVTLASNARAGTRGLALKKSDASQRLRKLPGGADDRFYQYADISGSVPLKWGEE